MCDDSERLQRYTATRDEKSFAEVVDRHIDLVHSTALRVLNYDHHAAADVTQQAFSILAQKASRLPAGTVISAWLHGLTRNLAVDYIRAEKRKRTKEQEASIMEKMDTEPKAEWSIVGPWLDSALAALKASDREAVILRYFSQQTFSEIARTLSLSEDAARMRVDRALDKLRLQLRRHGVASTAAGLSVALAQNATAAAPAGLAASVTHTAILSAGKAAGMITTLLHFMNLTKAGLLTLTVSSLLLVSSFYPALDAGNLRDRIASLRLQEASLLDKTRAVSAQISELRGATAQMANEAATLYAAAQKKQDDERYAKSDAFLARHPDILQLMRQQLRRRAEYHLRPFFREHQLTAAEKEGLLDIVSRDKRSIFYGQNGERMEYRLDKAGSDQPPNQQIAALLGTNLSHDYQVFSNSLDWSLSNSVAGRVASEVYFTDSPLSTEQAKQLISLVEQFRTPPPYRNGTFAWPEVIEKAKSFLNDVQIQSLLHQRIQDEVMRAQSTALRSQTTTSKRK